MRRLIVRKISSLLAFTLLLGVLGVIAPPVATAHPQDDNTCAEAPYVAPQGDLEPFLAMPFARQISKHNGLTVSQGWIVSEDEEAHVSPGEPEAVHGALDFEFSTHPNKGFGVPIFAPASGCIYSSYQSFFLTYVDDQGVSHQIGGGAGLFLELILDNGYVVQLVHAEKVASGIPHIPAVQEEDENGNKIEGVWAPTGIFKPTAELKKLGVRVQKGQFIALMGDTGIQLDYHESYDPATGTVAPRNRQQYPNWENGYAQLHLAVYAGRNQDGVRQGIVDPLGIYGKITHDHDPYNRGGAGQFHFGEDTVFLTRHGTIMYARP